MPVGIASPTAWSGTNTSTRKQQEVDSMKAQLEEAQRRLDEMREAARKEGFGSSVSDPE